jgi:hypothetical protein
MNIQTIIPIVIAALVVIVVGVILAALILRIRRQRLKTKFGPEYDYTVQKLGNRRSAEADLKEREKRVEELNIHPLEADAIKQYQDEWLTVQSRFVDDPPEAVENANRLITEVIIARGFPVADFEQRSADLSVYYPGLVPGYRAAYTILMKKREGNASTEELRQAMLNFHSLFSEIAKVVQSQEKLVEVAK